MSDPTMQLSRRERQIMDIIYIHRRASATQVLQALADPPSRTAVRTLLKILEHKGHLSHIKIGREFVYKPTRPRKRVGRSAFQRVLQTFYGGYLEQAVAAHLSDPSNRISPEELKHLSKHIRHAAKRGQ